MEWDTGAAHAVVIEAGKKVIQYGSNNALIYNKEDLLNPWFVVKK
jgi:3'(2'), 5'-bisphosphate nucleotidase